MKTQLEKAIINYYAPHKVMDVVDLYAWLAPDVTLVVSEALPWGGTYTGMAGIGHYITNITREVLTEFEVEEVYTSDDTVVVIGWSVGRVVRTGRPFRIRLTQLIRFNDQNKIGRMEFLSDFSAFTEQLELKNGSP